MVTIKLFEQYDELELDLSFTCDKAERILRAAKKFHIAIDGSAQGCWFPGRARRLKNKACIQKPLVLRVFPGPQGPSPRRGERS
jgi:hypothetical protein